MPHGITQYYLPPDRGDIPALTLLTPAEAGTRLSNPGGMQGWVDLVIDNNNFLLLFLKHGHLFSFYIVALNHPEGVMLVFFCHGAKFRRHYGVRNHCPLTGNRGLRQGALPSPLLRQQLEVLTGMMRRRANCGKGSVTWLRISAHRCNLPAKLYNSQEFFFKPRIHCSNSTQVLAVLRSPSACTPQHVEVYRL